MVEEAKLVETESGLAPAGPGWFVLNVADAATSLHDEFGASIWFQGTKVDFKDFGINIRVLQPGQPNCLYHAESQQEAFLVLDGECTLLVEGEERPLKPWSFVHLPAWTEHVIVAAGSRPCVVLMVGRRSPDEKVRYPVSELAGRYGASATEDTDNSDQAYARFGPRRPGRIPQDGLPWSR
jgi:uncharacterized cupin superfamily protein